MNPWDKSEFAAHVPEPRKFFCLLWYDATREQDLLKIFWASHKQILSVVLYIATRENQSLFLLTAITPEFNTSYSPSLQKQ